MKLQTAKCTTCGASLKLSQDKAISECSYCKSQIIVSNALDFAKIKLDRSEDIKKYRENLSKFVKNNSLDEILRVTGLIKDIIPDDNLASYYFAYVKQLMGSPKFIYQFYESKHLLTEDETEEIVNHIIEHSDLRDKTRVTSFLEEHASNKLFDYLEAYDARVIEEDNYSDIPRDIFICFSSENKPIAQKVYETLEADGYSTWISLKNLRPNNKENYWDDIKKAINSCSIVLVISSSQAMVSKDVIKEIEIAKKENKKLIEYKIDEVKHTSFFKYIFDGSKWVEGYTSKGLDNLKKRILEEKYVFNDKPEESNYQEVEAKPIKVKAIKQNSNKPKRFNLLFGGIFGVVALTIGLLISFSSVNFFDIINTSNSNQIIDIYVELLDIKFTELGSDHSSAISSTGRVFTWGGNSFGKLGDSTDTNKLVPTDITSKFKLNSNDKIVSLSLGGDHSSAVSSAGRVFTWGWNSFGQLGDSTNTNKSVPTEITSKFNLGSNDKIISLSLGGDHSSALSEAGRVFTWGANRLGQLGDNTNTNKSVPIDITSNFKLDSNDKIVNLSFGSAYSSAVSSTGRVFTWGWGGSGQLGNNTFRNLISVPTEITSNFKLDSNDKIVNLSSGSDYSSAISSTGRVFTWGGNNYGQLGDNTTTSKSVPTEITLNFKLDSNDKILSLSLGADHSSAISSNGWVFTWGRNAWGSLGNNSTTNSLVPTEITSRFNLDSNDKIVSLSLGTDHSSAVISTGRVFTWGWNGSGQLGDNTTFSRTVPNEI